MTNVRRTSTAFAMALALGLPALASAEQPATPLCDGQKAETKQPSAESAKQTKAKSGEKNADKQAPKSDDKAAPVESGRTS
jgi:hypothetical protein